MVYHPTHSSLGFKIKHLMITNVSGFFKISMRSRNNGMTSVLRDQLKAEIGSIDTNNAQRDAHYARLIFSELKNIRKWFFESTKVERVDEENYHVFEILPWKMLRSL